MKTQLRKTTKVVLLTALTAFTFISCEKDNLEAPLIEQTIVDQPVLSLENDIRYPEGAKATSFIRFASLEAAKDIKVFIAKDIPSEWVTATNFAIKEWSNASSSISMRTVANRAKADIVLTLVPDNPNSPAGASFPESDGSVGPTMDINPDFDQDRHQLDAKTRNLVMTHELGHNLGYQHHNDDIFFMSAFFTTIVDWNGITEKDKAIIRKQFP
ncbi:M57 family metalloprotease [Aquimarina aquimarini]|uniref:M57 family metalloprotease n=1 Tax=Aquimarina aquimarini TaxID=1191734 RepID=UPI001F3E0621|nr:M57 family metalloprotease [Aquimarina aquimarini]